jgi:branched-chain amino acid transport system permease protein
VKSEKLKIESSMKSNPPSPPFSKGGKGGFSDNRYYSVAKPFIIALWLSVLFLPFKGLQAAFLFFIIFSALLLSLKFLSPYKNIYTESLQTFSKKIHSLFTNRYLSLAVRSALLILTVILPFLVRDYFLDVAILIGIYVILALGLNVVVGFTGLLNLGFVAFYAIGAYTYALLNTKYGISFWPALPFSLVLTAAAGFLLAIPAMRLRGDYLAIVTLGFGEIVRLILNNWDRVTHGPNGISGIAPPAVMSISLGKLSHYYYLVLFFVFFTIFITKRVYSSRIGRAWVAIREDEIASSVTGINTTLYKLYAFAFGAFWAGIAGAVFAGKMQFVSPESFTFMESVLILCMVILGGLGSIPGVILGAFLLVLLPEMLREIQLYRMLALGMGLVLLMIFRPQGLLGGKGASIRS